MIDIKIIFKKNFQSQNFMEVVEVLLVFKIQKITFSEKIVVYFHQLAEIVKILNRIHLTMNYYIRIMIIKRVK